MGETGAEALLIERSFFLLEYFKARMKSSWLLGVSDRLDKIPQRSDIVNRDLLIFIQYLCKRGTRGFLDRALKFRRGERIGPRHARNRGNGGRIPVRRKRGCMEMKKSRWRSAIARDRWVLRRDRKRMYPRYRIE